VSSRSTRPSKQSAASQSPEVSRTPSLRDTLRERLKRLQRGERPNWSAAPKPSDDTEVLYANKRPELKRRDPSEYLVWVYETDAWQEIMVPVLDGVEEQWCRRRNGRGTAIRWTSHQLEAVFFFRYCCGKLSIRGARKALTGEDGVAACASIFADPKARRGGSAAKRSQGVPSEAGLSRHRKRLPDERRVELYRCLFERIVTEHLEKYAEFREECRLLDLDGCLMRTCHETPLLQKLPDGFIGPPRCFNVEKVLCWDGGRIPEGSSPDGHSGSGFNHQAITTSDTGLPVAIKVNAFHESEKDAGVQLVTEYGERVRPHMDPDKIAVLTADGGFNTPRLRRACIDAGIAENCHWHTHSITETKVKSIEKLSAEAWRIDGYPNWRANPLRELFCVCGKGRTSRKLTMRGGKAIVRTVGECRNCGSICITRGKWRMVENPNGFARMQPGDPPEAADWMFGNPLTYNDKLSRIYGGGRFGHNEGYNSSLANRFRICSDTPRRIRTLDQAEIEAYGVAIVQHAIAMGYRRLVASAAPPAPPPLRPPSPPPSLLAALPLAA
jgi:hypothetical protein